MMSRESSVALYYPALRIPVASADDISNSIKMHSYLI